MARVDSCWKKQQSSSTMYSKIGMFVVKKYRPSVVAWPPTTLKHHFVPVCCGDRDIASMY